jgi:hypothetical protein
MGDPFMQARTMALLEFACPPLPIADGKRMETDDRVIINSHDLISTFMAQAFKQKDEELNTRRKQRQLEIEDAYYQRLMSSEPSFQSIYNIMTAYTKEYLACFLLPPFTIHDVHVLPPDYISPALLNEIRDYCRALRIVHDIPPKADEEAQHTRQYYIKECFQIICQKERRQICEKKDSSI